MVSVDWYFLSHRLDLALAAKANHFRVVVMTPPGSRVAEITSQGLEWRPVYFSRKSINPFHELRSLVSIAWAYLLEKPDIVHNIALKPVVYGSIAARLWSIPAINTIAGMGYSLAESTFKSRFVLRALFFLLGLGKQRRGYRLVFQNHDDMDLFRAKGLAHDSNSCVIAGSGVDASRFVPAISRGPEEKLTVLLPSRMILQKGIKTFIDAAHLVLQSCANISFILAGPIDSENPAAVTAEELRSWCQDERIRWIGPQTDMVSLFQAASLVVLPSYYREGIPKALIEAAACGLPIITTDTPGCREIVRHGVNGLTVPPKDPAALAAGMLHLIRNPELRKSMGRAGRKMVEETYSMVRINDKYLEAYGETIGEGKESSIPAPHSASQYQKFHT